MWKRNHSLPEQIERGLVMNENLFRPQFDTLKLSDKLWLMQTLATRYNLTFKELYAFSRWGQSCTTGLFEKGGREFVFVPGDTVILGWESFVQGMDKANQEELADIFAEIEYEGSVEEFLRQGMTPVRQVTIGPMFVGRKLEEIGCNVCGGMGPLLGYLPCSPHCKPEVREDNEIHNDYDFFRPVIRVQTSGWRIVSPGDER